MPLFQLLHIIGDPHNPVRRMPPQIGFHQAADDDLGFILRNPCGNQQLDAEFRQRFSWDDHS